MAVPKQPKNEYSDRFYGVFGEFGAGENRRVRYIQGNLKVEDLDSVKMVSDLPGNEQWSIRELFQREIDETRVENDIVGYLTDDSKVKFFNPLTFVLLGKQGEAIVRDMPQMEEKSFAKGSPEHTAYWRKYYETGDVFRLKHTGERNGYAELEWNRKRAEVVAIDGQHRLSALKKIKQGEFLEKISHWKIPVVILVISPEKKGETVPIIESVRKLFLYINKEAHQPNKTRRIILDEEGINEMCVQEMLQSSKDGNGIPLLAYDWRGTEQNKKMASKGPVSRHAYTLLSAEGMCGALEAYILGENYETQQQQMLGIGPQDQSLYAIFESSEKQPAVSEDNAKKLRSRFGKRVMPGIVHFIREFYPYKGYIGAIQSIENNADKYALLALEHMRFGGTAINRFDDAEYRKIMDACGKIERQLVGYKKEQMPPLLVSREIGGFGVFFAFGKLFKRSGFSDFEQYAKSVTDAFNSAWSAGNKKGLEDILSLTEDSHPGIFHHIIFDHGQNIRNNRISNVGKGLGALIALVVTSHWEDINVQTRTEIAAHFLPILQNTLERGYKREVRYLLPADERDPHVIEKSAVKKANAQMRKIKKTYGFDDVDASIVAENPGDDD